MEAAKLTPQESGQLGGEANVAAHDAAYFRALGQSGGKATKAKYGRDYYREMGRKGAAARHAQRADE